MPDNSSNRPLLAATFVLGATALFGLIDNFVRVLAAHGGLWQFHLMRSALALVLLAVLARTTGLRVWPHRPGAVLARSLLTTLAMVIYFGSLAFLPIAEVVAGLFTAPIFVLIFSVAFFHQRIGIFRVLAVLAGFAGIMLVLNPDTGTLSVLTLLPVVAGALYGLGNIATRAWCEGESNFSLLGGFFVLMALWGALGLAVLALFPLPVAQGAAGFITRGWVKPDAVFLSWTAVQGAGSLLGVGLVTRGYQLGEASYVAVFEYSLLIFAGLWAALLWGQIPDPRALAGIALILASGVTIALRSR